MRPICLLVSGYHLLVGEAKPWVARHLAGCARCRAEAEAQLRMRTVIKQVVPAKAEYPVGWRQMAARLQLEEGSSSLRERRIAMGNWRRSSLPAAALLICVLGFALTYNRIHANSELISEDQAVMIAAGLLGVDPTARHAAKLDKVTDKTVPFVEIVDLPAWTVTFEDLAVTFPGVEQPKAEFATLTCLIDAKTGALLKVSSPLPAVGAVYNETHPEALADEMRNKTLTPIAASRLPDAGVKPLIPLLQELGKQRKTAMEPAKQLVAYLGLYTGNLFTTKFVEHPLWIVNTGGLKTSRGSDALFYVDAITGKVYLTRFLALPGEGDFGIPHPH